jgi:hypothetical protein
LRPPPRSPSRPRLRAVAPTRAANHQVFSVSSSMLGPLSRCLSHVRMNSATPARHSSVAAAEQAAHSQVRPAQAALALPNRAGGRSARPACTRGRCGVRACRESVTQASSSIRARTAVARPPETVPSRSGHERCGTFSVAVASTTLRNSYTQHAGDGRGRRAYAPFRSAPAGRSPVVTYRHRAITNLRATATIPIRRARRPVANRA